jgi:ATP adenylyltransferase
MNNLWSPWRSQYIESFHKEKKEEKCIFCNMEDVDPKGLDNLLIYKGKLSYIIMNLYPYNNGHLMVIPYKHTSNFQDLNNEELIEMMDLLKLAQQALTEILHPEGFNIGLNQGKCAGAGIDQHLHFHIVPRWNGDTNFMPVLGEVKIISQDLIDTKKKLQNYIVSKHL